MVGPALVVQIMIASCTSQQPSENFQKIGLLLTGPGWYIAPPGPHKEVRGRERKRKKKKNGLGICLYRVKSEVPKFSWVYCLLVN